MSDKTPTTKTPTTGEEMKKARKGRNLAVLALIFGLAALFYIITIVRMG